MNRIELAANFTLSRIVHGQMRMAGWSMPKRELHDFMNELIGMGITTFDHADIYGNYSCEAILGDVMDMDKSIRNRIEIITKCGIRLVSDKYPERKIKYYDYNLEHIISSAENSLKNLRTDHIDLLLLHRPAPFFDPEAVALAFSRLKKEGKVLHFGVSNFSQAQFEMLSKFTEEKQITNQVEISPYCLEHFDNGNIDFFMKEKIRPMAWSPLAGGKFLEPKDEKGNRIFKILKEIAEELNTGNIAEVAYAWLLKHPAGIMPVVGSGKTEHVRNAVDAMSVDMSLEQWYRIYVASKGMNVP